MDSRAVSEQLYERTDTSVRRGQHHTFELVTRCQAVRAQVIATIASQIGFHPGRNIGLVAETERADELVFTRYALGFEGLGNADRGPIGNRHRDLPNVCAFVTPR